ncbi:hypothetical protein PG985_016198 [Apiospora marii]|uniref:uncharacterized protein n=1 Tax=Apiospora marii TaxID=335849 RepID=UPI00313125EA
MDSQPSIPGLHQNPTMADMILSRQIYNGLPSDEDQPDIEEYMHDLAQLFVKYQADKVFGIHLAHGHFAIEDQTVLIGNKPPEGGRWTVPTAIDSDPTNIHGHVFILTDTGFHPYEYQAGCPPDLASVDLKFLPALANFIDRNGLRNVVALEVLDNSQKDMMEVVFINATMMINSSRLPGFTTFRQTGWAFTAEDGNARVRQDGNQTHAAGPKGGHVTITTPRDYSDALEFLYNEHT